MSTTLSKTTILRLCVLASFRGT
uniref:Uncharacterized protein n=1 Tax=Anguilla anguilla TaxID=7936 RepID=A0A0E9VXX9_ANGAN